VEPNFPAGSILMWSGNLVDLPDGYVICNGDNGTPDLRDRFITGAGTTYAVDETGGSGSHDHDLDADPHTHVPAGLLLKPKAGLPFNETLSSETITGTVDSKAILPPYAALYYVMKT